MRVAIVAESVDVVPGEGMSLMLMKDGVVAGTFAVTHFAVDGEES